MIASTPSPRSWVDADAEDFDSSRDSSHLAPHHVQSDDTIHWLPLETLHPHPLNRHIYGPPETEPDAEALLASIRSQGILHPLVVAPLESPSSRDGSPSAPLWQLLSGHRRWQAARQLGWESVPCLIRPLRDEQSRQRFILESNRHRHKTFTQTMREADTLERLLTAEARLRRLRNLRATSPHPDEPPDRRNSDDRSGRTDQVVGRLVGLGGKDRYRQARAIWAAAQTGDPRAVAAVTQLDQGSKTVHAAHKDLRRRDHLTLNFQPTPYDVWHFRHDRAYGVLHPGSIPPGIVAQTLHYYTAPGDLVVDPLAGGGVTLDVADAMGRRCLAYDIEPVRHDVRRHDVRDGIPVEARPADLVFLDPPYFTMLADSYPDAGASRTHLEGWKRFLRRLAQVALEALKPGGHVALLVANQTEKHLPPGHGYLDHGVLGYLALTEAGFLPQRRISCPMSGNYLPQQLRRARNEGRMLGQARDLLVMRKPHPDQIIPARPIHAEPVEELGSVPGSRSPNPSPTASS